jgi:hypothetical protein
MVLFSFPPPHGVYVNSIFKSVSQSRQADRKNVVDGELVSTYITLELEEQRRLARNIGTTPDQIIDNLREIDRATRLA